MHELENIINVNTSDYGRIYGPVYYFSEEPEKLDQVVSNYAPRGVIENSSDVSQLINYTFGFFDNDTRNNETDLFEDGPITNWWALVAVMLVACTAAGNVLVCLAIYLERRLQNVTNYFLMSLAITDLLVAVLVMPLGILTLFRGK